MSGYRRLEKRNFAPSPLGERLPRFGGGWVGGLYQQALASLNNTALSMLIYLGWSPKTGTIPIYYALKFFVLENNHDL